MVTITIFVFKAVKLGKMLIAKFLRGKDRFKTFPILFKVSFNILCLHIEHPEIYGVPSDPSKYDPSFDKNDQILN